MRIITILRTIVLTGLLASPILTAGQTTPFNREFYLGAKGGIVFSRVKFKPSVDENMYMGKSYGLVFRMISEPHVGIQAEFNYLEKGWEEKPLTGTTQSYYHGLKYFEVPVMTHANLGKDAFRFTFNLGPTIAFLVSEDQGMKPSDPPIPAQPDVAYWGKPVDSTLDFLFTGGVGTEYHSKFAGTLALDARVFYSLTNLYDGKTYGYDPSQTNGVVLSLTWLVRLDKARTSAKH